MNSPTTITYTLEITPRSHVRTTQGDRKCFVIPQKILQQKYPKLYKRKLEIERYNKYKEDLLWEAARKGFYLRDAGMEITFYVPVSPSWRKGKKEKRHLQAHLYRPDVDNLEKALFDGLRPHQDCTIWHIKDVKKLWINDTQGYIQVVVNEPPKTDGPTKEQMKIPFKK